MCLWRLQGASRVSCQVNYMVKGHPIEWTVVSSLPGKTLVLAWESRGTTMADFLEEVSLIFSVFATCAYTWRPPGNVYCHSQEPSHCFLRLDFSLEWNSPSRLGWLVNEPQDSSVYTCSGLLYLSGSSAIEHKPSSLQSRGFTD